MRDNEVVVRKRERELMFQTVWLFREGIHLASHPPRVLAYRQIVALHPIRIDHAADRRRPQGRFDLHGGPVDDAGGHMDHPTVRAFFDNDRVAQVGWRVAAGFGQTPTCPLTWRCAPVLRNYWMSTPYAGWRTGGAHGTGGETALDDGLPSRDNN
jgi:hypothetical protein